MQTGILKPLRTFTGEKHFFFFTFSHLFLLFNHGASLDWAWLFWLRHLQPPTELPFQAGSAWGMPAQRVKFGLLVCRHPPQLARPHHLCPPPPAPLPGLRKCLPLSLRARSLLTTPSPSLSPPWVLFPQEAHASTLALSHHCSFLPPVRLIPFCYFATSTSVSGTLEVCVLLHLDTQGISSL